MLTVGVPDRAVKEKMLRDGVPKHIIDPVMTRDNKPYIRHDGVMVRSVKRKVKQRRQRGLPTLLPKGRAFFANPNPTDNAAPYRKLFHSGIMPFRAVKQKMLLDGVSQSVVDILEAEASSKESKTPDPVGLAAAPPGCTVLTSNGVERPTRNSIQGRGGSERGALLRDIAAGRMLLRTFQPATTPSMNAFHNDDLDDRELVHKIQEIEDRQKKCLVLLDRLDPGCTITQRVTAPYSRRNAGRGMIVSDAEVEIARK